VFDFDGNSCFSLLHNDLPSVWQGSLTRQPAFVPILRNTFAITCGPLHLCEQIRYGLLSLALFISEKERIDLDISRIQKVGFLSPVIFNNSPESKMHDSLPFELFSPKTLSYIPFPDSNLFGERYDIPFVPFCQRPDVTRQNNVDPDRTSGNRILDAIRVCSSCGSSSRQ
jgi:hypothetical protein